MKIINKIKLSIKLTKFLYMSFMVKRRLEIILKDKEDKALPHPEMVAEKKKWALNALKIIGLQPELVFDKDFRLEDNMVLICNHRSFLDILLMEFLIYSLSEKESTFVAKKELETSFILGRLYTLFGTLFIDRSKPRDFVKLLKQIKKVLSYKQKGNMFVIYPEGTRNADMDKNAIGEFKEGFLKIAQQTKCNILPVFIEGGVESYFENYDGKKTKIKIKVGSIMESKEATANEIEEQYKKIFELA